MRIVQVVESRMSYAARSWDEEHATRYVLDLDGRLVEFSHFRHRHAGSYVKDVIEVASSFGCTVGCHHCAAADLPQAQALSADEIVACTMLLAERHGVADSARLLITYSGIGEASLLRRSVFDSAERLQAAFPQAEFIMTTVGVRPEFLHTLGDVSERIRLRLVQVSQFSADSAVVRGLMPLGDRLGYDVTTLVEALAAEARLRYRINLVVMAGVNDSPEQVGALLSVLEPVRQRSVLRVSRLNRTSASERHALVPPPTAVVEQIAATARGRGWDAYAFYSHGDDRLNCGQLTGDYLVTLGIPVPGRAADPQSAGQGASER